MNNVSQVEVTVTVVVNGSTITEKSASGSTSDNPFRLADSIMNAARSEAGNALSEPRMAWDAARQAESRRGRN